MKGKNYKNIDTGIEKIRSIYLNSVADAIVNNTMNYESKFKPVPDNLATRIAQEFVMDFLKSHQMDAAFREISIETHDVIKQERTHKYIARKLNLDPKKPFFRQIREELDIKTVTETVDGDYLKLPKPSITLTQQPNQPHDTYLKSQDMSEFTGLLESRTQTQTGESRHKHHKKEKTVDAAPKSIQSRGLKSKSSALSTREHYTGLTPTLTSLQTKTFIQPTQEEPPKNVIVTKTGENLYELFQFDGVHEIGPATRMMLEIKQKMVERETAYERIPVADTTVQSEELKTNTTLRSLQTRPKESGASTKDSAPSTKDSTKSTKSTKSKKSSHSTKDSAPSTHESTKSKSGTHTKTGTHTHESVSKKKTGEASSDAHVSNSYEEEDGAEEESIYVEVSNSN